MGLPVYVVVRLVVVLVVVLCVVASGLKHRSAAGATTAEGTQARVGQLCKRPNWANMDFGLVI